MSHQARAVIVLPPGATYEQLEQVRDEWVDVRGFGDTGPEYLLATDGREATIRQAREAYVHDRIDLDEFELRVEAALRGNLISTRAALAHYEAQAALHGYREPPTTWGTVMM